jgi:hypothetical protein
MFNNSEKIYHGAIYEWCNKKNLYVKHGMNMPRNDELIYDEKE